MATKRTNDPALEQAMAEALKAVETREAHAKGDEGAADDVVGEGAQPDGPATGELAALTAALAEKTAEGAAQKDQMLRLAADFDNYRKRSQREQEEARRFGIERLLRDILPVLDNLDRALAHAQNEADPVILGVRMVVKQFTDALGQHGVRVFSAKQEPFDPERHEAISQVAAPELAPGTIVEELQRGYMIHDRLLRPARVVIAALPQVDDTQPENTGN